MAQTAIKLFWVSMICMSAVLTLTAFVSPHWIVSSGGNATCGLIKFCNTDVGDCVFPYDNYGDNIQDIPGVYWQSAATTACFGAGIAALTSITAVFALCFRTLISAVYYATWVIAFLLFAAMALVVAGFGEIRAPEVSNTTNNTVMQPDSCQICGPSTSAFNLEECEIGLSFILAVLSTAMAMVACVVGRVFVMPAVDELDYKSR